MRPNNQVIYTYVTGGYEPLARLDTFQHEERTQHDLYYYHTHLNGMPEELTDEQGELVWQGETNLWGKVRREWSKIYFVVEQNLRFQGQYADRETGLYYNTFRYYDPVIGHFTIPDPIGLAGGINTYAYAPNPLMWVDPLGLSCGPSFFKGKMDKTTGFSASQMKTIKAGTKEWKQAIKEMQDVLNGSGDGRKFQVRVGSSSDAKAFLKEAQGNMNRYRQNTYSRAPGSKKYPKGYERHTQYEGDILNLNHIKWYNNGADGHIFYDIPN